MFAEAKTILEQHFFSELDPRIDMVENWDFWENAHFGVILAYFSFLVIFRGLSPGVQLAQKSSKIIRKCFFMLVEAKTNMEHYLLVCHGPGKPNSKNDNLHFFGKNPGGGGFCLCTAY